MVDFVSKLYVYTSYVIFQIGGGGGGGDGDDDDDDDGGGGGDV